MLERSVYNKLREWRANKNKKALCIIGARQIGKTTIIREFAKHYYENFLEINFILDQGADRIFEGRLDANTIIENLTAFKLQQLVPGKTLIFLDEIQECPKARAAIKFLVEDARFDYIESGSLLGIRYKDVPSYAVGFEEIYYMYPMSFEEYAAANGVPEQTFELLRRCYEKKEAVPLPVHETMRKLFYTYLVVGGMPAVVQEYIQSHDIGRVVQSQKDILALYRLDISKYTSGSDKVKVQDIFDSIPAQLNEKNRRFVLKKIDENGRMNRYENAFLWLANAGVAIPVYNIEEPAAPLKLNEKHSLFKLFMGDTGLLCAACMNQIQFDLLSGNLDVNMGSILENGMAQSLRCNGFDLYYFSSKKYGEVDFVIQNGTKVDLIEVKSGADFKKHPALHNVAAVSNWKFDQKLVFCRGNMEADGDITYLPWYMIMFYQPDQIPEGSIFQLDLSALM